MFIPISLTGLSSLILVEVLRVCLYPIGRAIKCNISMTTLEPVSGQFFLYFKYSSIQEKHLALHQRTVSERTLELSSKYHLTPLYPVIFAPLHPHDLTEEAEWLKHIKLSIQSWICTQENKLLPVWQGEGQGRYCLVWDINWTFALKFKKKKK